MGESKETAMPYVISEYDVGPRFEARAIAHFRETGEPLMAYQWKQYRIVLGTESSFTSCGGYALTDPTVEAEPSLTWRELAERAGCPVEDYAAAFNLEDDELDDAVPGEYFQERDMGMATDGRAVAFDVINGCIPGSWQYETPSDE